MRRRVSRLCGASVFFYHTDINFQTKHLDICKKTYKFALQVMS